MAGFTLKELEAVQGRASEWVLDHDCADTGADPAAVRGTMRERLRLMRASVTAGLASSEKSLTGMVGWNAKGLWSAPDVLDAPLIRRVQAYAMAVNEENARMKRIVAAPTAGSAGTVPGALLGVADHLRIEDEKLVMPLVLAAGIGQAISRQMHISGSAGGLILWPARILLPVGFALLSLQGLSELIKRIAFIADLGPDPVKRHDHNAEAELAEEIRRIAEGKS